MNQKLWDNSVHGTTVFWLVIFFIGLFAFDSDIFGYDEPIVAIPEEWEDPWEIISWIIWIVFVVDLFSSCADQCTCQQTSKLLLYS